MEKSEIIDTQTISKSPIIPDIQKIIYGHARAFKRAKNRHERRFVKEMFQAYLVGLKLGVLAAQGQVDDATNLQDEAQMLFDQLTFERN